MPSPLLYTIGFGLEKAPVPVVRKATNKKRTKGIAHEKAQDAIRVPAPLRGTFPEPKSGSRPAAGVHFGHYIDFGRRDSTPRSDSPHGR